MRTCPTCGSERGRHTYGCRDIYLQTTSRKRRAAEPSTPAQLEPRVLNRHHFKGKAIPKPWTYIGRAAKGKPPSPLGNPFTKAEHGEEAIDLYRQHLRKAVEAGDEKVLAALAALTPAHSLVCSCAPRACHGDVVLEVWREFHGGEPARKVADP